MGKCMSKPAVAVSNDGSHHHHAITSSAVVGSMNDTPITMKKKPPRNNSKNRTSGNDSVITSSAVVGKSSSSKSINSTTSSAPTKVLHHSSKNNTNGTALVSSSLSTKKSMKLHSSSMNNSSSMSGSEEEQDLRLWKDIFVMAKESIIDPADVHAVMDERISAIIDDTNPAEITLLQRRLREMLQLSKETQLGGASSSSYGNGTNSTGMSSTASAVLGTTMKRWSSSGAERQPPTNSNSTHGTMDVDAMKKSRSTYQKEYVLDEYLFRSLFCAADRILKKGHPTQSNLVNLSRNTHRVKTNSSSSCSSDYDKTEGSRPFDEEPSISFAYANNNIQSSNSSFSKKRFSKKHTSSKQSSSSENQLDPIGAAYLLALFLAENRWDHVSSVANVTANKAKLVLDVNKKTTEESSAMKQIQNQDAVNIPHPTSLHHNIESPPLANGASFPSICFLLSFALKGTRQQKLTLLFYLLLPLETLKSILLTQGTPTWLLEVGSTEFLSLASLSHYYHYGGVLPFETLEGKRIIPGNQHLVLNSKHAIQIMTILLTGEQPSSLNHYHEKKSHDTTTTTTTTNNNNVTNAHANSPAVSSSSHKKDLDSSHSVPSSSSKSSNNNNKVHSYMTHCLRQIREGSMEIPIEQKNKELLQTFWAASLEHYDVTRAWNFEEFWDWSNQALDDVALHTILEQIFGYGIIPSASLERILVDQCWMDWHHQGYLIPSHSHPPSNHHHHHQSGNFVTHGFRNLFHHPHNDPAIHNNSTTTTPMNTQSYSHSTWGHIGGLDQKGGLGHGILYCVDKNWWCQWLSYTNGDAPKPHDLSNESLLETDDYGKGTQGSFEVMKSPIKNNIDYVLVPPAVWDLLYELYGGGPPLPRMVLPFTLSSDELPSSSIEVSLPPSSPLQIPPEMSVMTHPWIIHCQICDPHQPYRRGDVGAISIRIMASPDEPMWRLFSEIVTRLPISYARAKDASSQGRARLWKRVETTATPEPSSSSSSSSSGASRYGPWSLLCKSRFATFPMMVDSTPFMKEEDLDFYKKDWEEYSDHSTVGSIGLHDGSRVMFEYALLRKDGIFTWPREAAAKAGRLRRVADEDSAFRRLLRGVDEDGKAVKGRPPLIGKTVDAMDASGRWYQVEITAVDSAVDDSNDEGEEEDDSDNENSYMMDNGKNNGESKTDGRNNNNHPAEIKVVRVDFSEFGGHEEWIDVNSDRIAVSGRFTMDSIRTISAIPGDNSSVTSSLGDSKSRLMTGSKKSVSSHDSSTEVTSTGAVCPFPGFGACGLTNLGNTCYANSALQCISYMPLLRSYLLSNQFKICGDLNKDNPLGTGGKLLEEFADLLKLMWSAKYASRAPTRFRAQLGKARQQYSAADQQDAQELLNDMLDTLHEDSNKIKKKPYVEALEDEWVKVNGLPRVGNEAWRRFLRRNRSVIADVAMGQVLNRVTCVVCNHTSRNFDPFNMLSIPFPTVSEVIFRCRVLRRATNLNCASTLSIDLPNGDSEPYEKIEKKQLHPPSTSLAMEEYVIPMSRLADIGDLKLQIQKLSGISTNRLKLCKTEEIVSNPEAEVKSRSRTYIKVSALPDKEGPCVQLAKQGPTDDVSAPVAPTTIIAFESTLNNRPLDTKKSDGLKNEFANENSDESTNDDTTADEDEEDETMGLNTRGKSSSQKSLLQEQCALYGDGLECRVYDTNPLPLAKAMSRSMWPKSPSGFKLGLRVDAIDHRDHWFPGSVVEIIQGTDDGASDEDSSRKGTKKTQVRIHFDNFSSKWDEKYTIEHFQRGQVRPLYSHANPKAKPTEFLVHHRHNRTGKTNTLFGQSFFVQCHIEWSTVRAGAQILAQAARFLQPPPFYPSGLDNLDNDETRTIVWQKMDQLGFHRADIPNDKELEVYRTTNEINSVLSEIIDVLIEADRLYVASALSISSSSSDKNSSSFNISAMSARLSKKLTFLLPSLPFEIKICAADSPLGSVQGSNNSDEVVFPFSLVRTIGNYMNARHAVVLHWRDSMKSSRSPRYPLMYIPPFIGVHKRGRSILNAAQKTVSEHNKKEKNRKNHESGSSGGIPLGVCLTEFCKEQQSTCWRCPKCKEVRDTKQSMALWRLPDLLTFHMKRYNCSARWREKITTKVNFPLTSLNMKEWCDQQSPAFHSSEDSFVYDLIGVVNHYGGMTGGHYVATCKATPCGSEGSEEVSHSFSGAGINVFEAGEESSQSVGWKIGRNKDKDTSTMQTRVANANAKSVAESSEPLWLQFDDDLVEPIPPNTVVSEMAYVLFYRRRRISPSNIAKYSTLE